MKVLLINTIDVGGAAKACIRLHEGLLNEGVNSNILFKSKQNNFPFTHSESLILKKKTKVERIRFKILKILKELNLLKVKPSKEQLFLANRPSDLELFSYPVSNFDITQSKLYKEADIINLHWVADFLDYKSFFEKNTKPVVWTLHDMHPFTGGEHFEEKYIGIDLNGEPIEREKMGFEKKMSLENLNFIKKIIKNVNNLTIVSPSLWLANEAKRSEVFKDMTVMHIPNSLNPEIFKPRDKKYSREFLNIPQNKKVILFVADSVNNNRKGFVFLEKAFQELKNENIFLCSIGKNNGLVNNSENILELGSIYDERLMSMVYSAADVFVIPSLMDNLPNTVLESIMCGTPVIGFPIGGITDMIQEGENGLLTKEISVSSLLETLTKFLNLTDEFDRDAIRYNALKKYDQKIQSARYIALFEDVLK